MNAVNVIGQTALHGAAKSRYDAVVQELVHGGAKINVADSAGVTPIIAAERVEVFAGRSGI